MSKRDSLKYKINPDLSDYEDNEHSITHQKKHQNLIYNNKKNNANLEQNIINMNNKNNNKKNNNKNNKNNKNNIKNLIGEQKNYYSIDIEVYGNYGMDEIIAYIKHEWVAYKKLYNYCVWLTCDEDMIQLSEMFMECKFTLFCKGEFFIDAYHIKTFHNGYMKYLDCQVSCKVNITLPDNSVKQTDNKGVIILDNNLEKILVPKDRKINISIKQQLDIATDLLVALGQNVSNIGTAFTETLLASKLLSSCLAIVDMLHQNYTKYGDNKSKCYNLNLRCKNILNTMQKIPPNMLNLSSVVNVVSSVRNALDLINEYNSKWRITKFFSSSRYQDLFITVNTDLSNFYYDFGINYTINRKTFEIIGSNDNSDNGNGIGNSNDILSPSYSTNTNLDKL